MLHFYFGFLDLKLQQPLNDNEYHLRLWLSTAIVNLTFSLMWNDMQHA